MDEPTEVPEVPEVEEAPVEAPVVKQKQKRKPMSEEQKAKAIETLKRAREIKLTKYPKGTKRDSAIKKKMSMEEESINALALIKAQEILEKKRVDAELAEYRLWKKSQEQVNEEPPKKKKAPAKPKATTATKPKAPPKKKKVVKEESEDEQQPPQTYGRQYGMFNMDDFLD